MKKIQKHKYQILIFFTETVYMTLELLASRVLSPTFGARLEVWTSIIGIILLSSSLGNYYGGKLADKNKKNVISNILLLTSISILIIPLLSNPLLDINVVAYNSQFSVIVFCLIISALLFFLPGFLIGMLTPIIVTNEIKDNKAVGTSSGKIYSAMTIGGLFGTFISGFFLIPNFGTVELIYILAFIMLIISFIVNNNKKKYSILYILIILIITGLFSHTLYIEHQNRKDISSYNENKKVSLDTKYGRVIISYGIKDNYKIKILNIDGGFESAMYVDKDKENDLVFEYLQKYGYVLKKYSNPKNLLMIGGGAYSFPKYIVSNTKSDIDVVEIDSEITKIAKKYFGLDKTMKKYPNRIKNYNEDGRTYLNNNKKKYDMIFNDAFSGQTPAKTLTTKEAVEKVSKSLNDDGMYVSNIIGAINGKHSYFLKYEIKTMKTYFKYIYVIQADEKISLKEKQNLIVICSNKKYKFDNEINNIDLKDAKIITDNYYPIEHLTK